MTHYQIPEKETYQKVEADFHDDYIVLTLIAVGQWQKRFVIEHTEFEEHLTCLGALSYTTYELQDNVVQLENTEEYRDFIENQDNWYLAKLVEGYLQLAKTNAAISELKSLII